MMVCQRDWNSKFKKKLAHRAYPKADVQNLISEDLFSEKATYLCDVCAKFSKSENGDKV